MSKDGVPRFLMLFRFNQFIGLNRPNVTCSRQCPALLPKFEKHTYVIMWNCTNWTQPYLLVLR